MNYRCYHINNFYLSGIHAGIQSAHAQHELAMKYLTPNGPIVKSPFHQPAIDGYVEWATNHKTIIVLNGGMQADLEKWVELLSSTSHAHAWATFHEAPEALNGALTNIALVLPERIYGYAREVTRVLNSETFACLGEGLIFRLEDNAQCTIRAVGQGGAWLEADDGDQLTFSPVEISIMEKLSKCHLMGN